MGLWTHWTHSEMDLNLKTVNGHEPPLWLGDHSDVLDLQELLSLQRQGPAIPQRLLTFPNAVTLVNSCMSHWGQPGETIKVCMFDSLVGSFLREYDLPFIQRFWIWKLAQSGNCSWGHDSLFWWFKLDFCSLDLALFHLHRSNKNIEDGSCIFPLRALWLNRQYHMWLLN